MLVLTRKVREAVVVGESGSVERLLKVTVLGISAGKVRLGFEVAADVPIHRLEVWERICAAEQAGSPAERAAEPNEESGRWDDDGGRRDIPTEVHATLGAS